MNNSQKLESTQPTPGAGKIKPNGLGNTNNEPLVDRSGKTNSSNNVIENIERLKTDARNNATNGKFKEAANYYKELVYEIIRESGANNEKSFTDQVNKIYEFCLKNENIFFNNPSSILPYVKIQSITTETDVLTLKNFVQTNEPINHKNTPNIFIEAARIFELANDNTLSKLKDQCWLVGVELLWIPISSFPAFEDPEVGDFVILENEAVIKTRQLPFLKRHVSYITKIDDADFIYFGFVPAILLYEKLKMNEEADELNTEAIKKRLKYLNKKNDSPGKHLAAMDRLRFLLTRAIDRNLDKNDEYKKLLLNTMDDLIKTSDEIRDKKMKELYEKLLEEYKSSGKVVSTSKTNDIINDNKHFNLAEGKVDQGVLIEQVISKLLNAESIMGSITTDLIHIIKENFDLQTKIKNLENKIDDLQNQINDLKKPR